MNAADMQAWTVFVGGVEVTDHLLTHANAETLAETYHADDYDDVQIAFVNVWGKTDPEVLAWAETKGAVMSYHDDGVTA